MIMFRWEDSSFLIYLLTLIIIAFIWYLTERKKDINRSSIHSNKSYNSLINFKTNEKAKIIVFSLVFLFSLLALANPQSGLTKKKQKVEKTDIMIALDISNSMNAQDISPSRLERSKRLVSNIIQARKSDQIGLILFAGSAFLQMPLTTDMAAAEMFIKSANTDIAGTQGTNIGEAIELAMKSVKEDHQRALIIISDGEDHEGYAESAASKAASIGWRIFTIGVGSTEGAMIPININGNLTYLTNKNGDPVKTSFSETTLRSVSDKGNGTFFKLSETSSNIVADISQQIDNIQKYGVDVNSYNDFKSYYQFLLFPALILLLGNFFYDYKLGKP